jgi:protein phosphatase
MAAADSPERAAEDLVELALRGGGPDNITAIVADVVDVEASPSALPLTVGAAAEGPERRSTADSSAAKAAALAPPLEERDPAAPPAGYEEHRPHWGRRISLLVLLLILLGAGGSGAWAWSQRQYYVGAADQNVAIFKGLTEDVGPLRTSKLYHREDIALSDLPDYQRSRVNGKITTEGLSDAQRIVHNLREQAAACRAEATATAAPPSPSPSASPTATGSATAKPISPSPTASPSASPTASSTASPTPRPSTADELGCGGPP